MDNLQPQEPIINEPNENVEQKKDKALEILREGAQKTQQDTKPEEKANEAKVNVDEIIHRTNLHMENILKNERDTFIETDKEFLKFLSNFVHTQDEKEKQKIALKEVFFVIVMFGFLILLATPFALVFCLKDLNQITAIVSLVTILGELLSAIIVLPKIIAVYLFNKEEDGQLMKIIESMQKYNQSKRDHIERN